MRVSLGYNNIDGILKASNFERYNAGVSLTPKLLNDNLLVTLNAKVLKQNTDMQIRTLKRTSFSYMC